MIMLTFGFLFPCQGPGMWLPTASPALIISRHRFRFNLPGSGSLSSTQHLCMYIKKKKACNLPRVFSPDMTLTIQYIGHLKNQITYDFHININSHQWRFGEGRGRNGSFTFFHIDFPQKCPGSKSTSKAPGLSALCRLSQREEVDCFQLLLLFCFFFLSSWENVNLFRRSFWESQSTLSLLLLSGSNCAQGL